MLVLLIVEINKVFFKEITDFLQEDLIMDIFIMQKENNEKITFMKPNVSSDVQKKFRSKFLERIKKIYDNYEKSEFEEYHEESKSGVIFYLHKEDMIPTRLIEEEIVDFDTINNFQDLLEGGIWGLIFNFKNRQGKFLRIYFKYKKSMFLKKSWLHALIFTEESLIFLQKDILSYDFTIHSLFFKDMLIIKQKYFTEMIFEFQKLFKTRAIETLKEIKKLPFKIKNFDFFKSKCTEVPGMARKMTNIFRKKYYQNLTYDKVKTLVEEYGLNLKLNNKNQTIEIPNFKNIWELLHILDDAYLKSEVTNNKYEASVKKEK